MCEYKNAVVLVIDDCEDNLFLMELMLADNGYKVETACCGKEGVLKIRELIPDLIILDMMMPDMTGLEVIDSIKPDSSLSQIPIIVCTANRFINKDDVSEVEDICYKPVNLANLLTQISSLIGCCEDIDRQNTIHFDRQLLSAS